MMDVLIVETDLQYGQDMICPHAGVNGQVYSSASIASNPATICMVCVPGWQVKDVRVL